MKIRSLVLFLFLTICSIVCAQQENTIIEINESVANAVIEKVKSGGAYLIDVRTPEEYKSGHIKYSQNIDIHSEDFVKQFETLDKNKEMYLYCGSGKRSGKASDTLQALGYKNSYNIGGLEKLKTLGMPLE